MPFIIYLHPPTWLIFPQTKYSFSSCGYKTLPLWLLLQKNIQPQCSSPSFCHPQKRQTSLAGKISSIKHEKTELEMSNSLWRGFQEMAVRGRSQVQMTTWDLEHGKMVWINPTNNTVSPPLTTDIMLESETIFLSSVSCRSDKHLFSIKVFSESLSFFI